MKRLIMGVMVLSSMIMWSPVVAVEGLALELRVPEQVKQGEVFQVPVYLRQSEAYLDTIRLDVQYNTQAFDVIHMELGNIFPYVSPNSTIDDEAGRIYFGGYRTAGPTNQSGLFGTLTMKANDSTGGDVVLSDKTLLLGAGKNFNQATPVKYTIKFIGESKTVLNNEVKWVRDIEELEIGEDTLVRKSPEVQDSEAVEEIPIGEIVDDGLWYRSEGEEVEALYIDKTLPNKFLPFVEGSEDGLKIYFATTDQASGVSHYELYLDGKIESDNAKSPYLLKGYKNVKILEVRAYDNAGNYQVGRVELNNIVEGLEYRPAIAQLEKAASDFTKQDFSKKRNKIIYIVLMIIGLFVVGSMVRSIKRRG